jgi:Putative auto-transporter adhesin, head GIN domain
MKQLVTAVAAFFMLTSCTKENLTGSGSIQTENRNITGFTKIDVAGRTGVTITPGSSFNVSVKGYSNLLPVFETKLIGNTLKLGFKTGTSINNDNTEVSITMPVLAGIISNGSSTITIGSGSTAEFAATINGSSQINAFGMQAKKAELEINGSGVMRISVSDVLKAKLSGSGIIYYKGNPSITSSITGSGRLQKQ